MVWDLISVPGQKFGHSRTRYGNQLEITVEEILRRHPSWTTLQFAPTLHFLMCAHKVWELWRNVISFRAEEETRNCSVPPQWQSSWKIIERHSRITVVRRNENIFLLQATKLSLPLFIHSICSSARTVCSTDCSGLSWLALVSVFLVTLGTRGSSCSHHALLLVVNLNSLHLLGKA